MSLPHESDVSDEGEWLDLESDEESIAITSLFDAQTFPTVSAMLDHCKQHHDFDFAACVRRLGVDFHGAVKLVNYIRDSAKQGVSLPKEISLKDFQDDRFLQPVLENDALIFSLDEILEAEEGSPELNQASSDNIRSRNKDLEAELEKVRSQFANYRLAVQETLDRRWGDDKDPGPGPSSAEPKKDTHAYYFESYASHGKGFKTVELGRNTNRD